MFHMRHRWLARFFGKPGTIRTRALRPLLALTELEDRCVPADWTPLGPGGSPPPTTGNNPLQAGPFGVGTYSGRVTSIVVSPSYGNAGATLFVGTASGGVWSSTNALDPTVAVPTWVPLTDTIAFNGTTGAGVGANTVGSMAVDPNNSSRILVGTGESNYGTDGLFGAGVVILQAGQAPKLYADATTWTRAPGAAPVLGAKPTANFFWQRSISSIVFDAQKNADGSRTVYLAANSYAATDDVRPNDNIYSSTDGTSWTEVAAVPGGGTGNLVTDVTDVLSTDPKTKAPTDDLIAGTGKMGPVGTGGIWVSTNGGAGWTGATLPDAKLAGLISRVQFATDTQRNIVYAALWLTSQQTEVLVSYDGGRSWAPTPAQPPNFAPSQGYYNLAIGVSQQSGRVYVGGESYPTGTAPKFGIYESNAPTVNPAGSPPFTSAGGWRAIDMGANKIYPHTDLHAWAFDSGGNVYAGTDGGIYRFTPGQLDPEVLDAHPAAGAFPNRQILAVADLNGDQQGDIIYSGSSADGKSFDVGTMMGQGNGRYVDTTWTADLHLNAVAVDDFTGDGVPDVLGLATATNEIWLLPGKGDGTFAAPKLVANLGANAAPTDLAVGDFNGDRILDVAVAEKGANRVAIYLGQAGADGKANGTFKLGKTISRPAPFQIQTGDFNGDGNTDLLVLNGTVGAKPTGGPGDVQNIGYGVVLFGDGKGNFSADPNPFIGANLSRWVISEQSAINPPNTLTPAAVRVADFNGDGRSDVVEQVYDPASKTNNQIVVYLTRADGRGFTKKTITLPDGASMSSAAAIAVGDFNSDGHVDIAVIAQTKYTSLPGAPTGDALFVVYGDGAGNFSAPVRYDIGFVPTNNPGVKPPPPAQPNAQLFVGAVDTPSCSTDLVLADSATVAGALTNRYFTLFGNDFVKTPPTQGNWNDLNGNLATLQVNSVGVNPAAPNQYLIASQDNGFGMTTNGGASWNMVGIEDGMAVGFQPGSNQIVFALTQDGKTYRTPDVNKTTPPGWVRLDSFAKGEAAFKAPFAIDQSTAGVVAVASPKLVWVWNGTKWASKSPPLPEKNQITALSIAPQNSKWYLVGFSGGGAAVSLDGGATWANKAAPGDGMPMFPAGGPGKIVAFAVEPTATNLTAYAARTRFDNQREQILQTTDGGKTWTDITGTLPPTVGAFSLAVLTYGGQDHVFVGTSVGVYEGVAVKDGAKTTWTWNRLGSAMPNVRVTDLQVRRSTQDGAKIVDLVAATYGRGVWVMGLLKNGDRVAALGGTVWQDAVATGTQGVMDPGEPGVAGVSVELLDANKQLVANTVTGANGQYVFSGVGTGTYTVHFGLPPGDQFVAANVGTPQFASAVISGGDTAAYPVTGDPTQDAGLQYINAGLTVDPTATAGVSGTVWNITTGTPGSGGTGISGALVTLLDAQGAAVASTQADVNGNYSFANLAAALYQVLFTTPSGFAGSPGGPGSAADPTTGLTAAFSLAAGQVESGLDAGFDPLSSISGSAWQDLSGTGIRNTSDPVLGGVEVDLSDATGTQVATAHTDDNGNYAFGNLLPGNYAVRVVSSAHLTLANTGSDPTTDSAFDPNTDTLQVSLGLAADANNIDVGLLVNSKPVGVDSAYYAAPDRALTVSASTGVLASATDADGDALTAGLVTGPQNGTLALDSAGSFTYTPTTGFVGQDTFTYQPADPIGPGDLTTVTIQVGDQVFAPDASTLTGENQTARSGGGQRYGRLRAHAHHQPARQRNGDLRRFRRLVVRSRGRIYRHRFVHLHGR
jgi:hypothetical protein